MQGEILDARLSDLAFALVDRPTLTRGFSGSDFFPERYHILPWHYGICIQSPAWITAIAVKCHRSINIRGPRITMVFANTGLEGPDKAAATAVCSHTLPIAI